MKYIFGLGFLFLLPLLGKGQQLPESQQLAEKVLNTKNNSSYADDIKVLKAMEATWLQTADNRYFNYIKETVDKHLSASANYTQINSAGFARSVLMLYRVLEDDKYYNLLPEFDKKLKARYPLNVLKPGTDTNYEFAVLFNAEYAKLIHDSSRLSGIVSQLVAIEKQLQSTNSHLIFVQGQYAVALVDMLEILPDEHPARAKLAAALNRVITAVKPYQHGETGLWNSKLSKAKQGGKNFGPAASAMLVYAIAKGVRLGDIDNTNLSAANKAYNSLRKNYIDTGISDNYPMFICASAEIERATIAAVGKRHTVLLDSYFNSETIRDKSGITVPYHYQWNEMFNNGFSLLGSIFNTNGFKTKTLYTAPTHTTLKNADVYIIVDPDIPKENPTPNYITDADVTTISNWVKEGGVLAVFGNDKGNAEFQHLNKLMDTFGIQFMEGQWKKVEGV
ncbi:MAG: hypothetical protein EOP46_13975, partial [Sphingobacteriaceae bacterium]